MVFGWHVTVARNETGKTEAGFVNTKPDAKPDSRSQL